VVLASACDTASWDVSEGYSGVEGGGDERGPQPVWCDSLVDPCSLGQPTDDPSRGVTVETGGGVAVQQDRPLGSLPDAEVDGPSGAWCDWDGDDAASFPGDGHDAVTPHHSGVLDVGTKGF